MKAAKVIVIFPKYFIHDGSHFPYWYRVFEVAGTSLDLAVLFESGQIPVKIKNLNRCYLQRVQSKPINLCERLVVLLYWIFLGYKKIYIHYSLYSFLLVWLLRPILGLKIYLWDCELYSELPSNKLLVWAIRQTDVLVTGSQMIAQNYREVFKLGKKEIKVVPNYVEPVDVVPLKLDANKQHILFVHHLSPRKGSRELPAIIKEVLDQKSKVIFHLVGSGPDFTWLKSNCRQYGGSVKLYGQLTLPEVAAMMKAAKLLILPSLAEGFPRVILEAMLYQLPFVSYDVGNVFELAGKNQKDFIVKTGDRAAFSRKVVELLNYPQLPALISQNKHQLKRYTLKAAKRAYTNLFITS